ncbi:MAG: T9SS type A sorting domain-containing protein [Bacteroidota bacterium]
MSTRIIIILIFFSSNLVAQESPFGTGQINNQDIGQLDDASVITPSQSGFGFLGYFPDAQQLLQDYTFDIYVPDDYDGTEPYGLVTFINSGNNGGFKSQWLPVLDDKKLIWIAGDNIGNSIFINIRMGVGMAAVLRMQELFNIDPDRIYTSGNSGGARMAHNLAFIYPETFSGGMPSCGGSYIRQVDQDYETQNPDGHYEAILPYASNYLDYLLPFDQRIANMTSFNDFREGDIMNIYHNGVEQDGLKGKFLETDGSHCATTTEHFEDAVNYVEHPFLTVIQEDFTETSTAYFKTTNATFDNNDELSLVHNNSAYAQIQSSDLFLWNDPYGAILETTIQPDPANFNMNTAFKLGIWSMENPNNYCGFVGNQLHDDIPAILLSIDFIGPQPNITVEVKNPNQPATELLFASSFSDWDVNEPLPIKYHLWDKELRIELGAHLAAPTTTANGTRLLDDARSIRIRWHEVVSNFWDNTPWADGAFMTLTSEKDVPAESASNLFIDRVELITADTEISTEIPNTTSEINATICAGDTYAFFEETIAEAGTYFTTLPNAAGCDSTITLDLSINALPTVTIEEMNGTLSTDNTFPSYQWYLDGMAINDENGPTIMPNENGDYYVEVTNENGCMGISNTVSFVSTSVEIITSSEILVYPNPTNGELVIDTEGANFKAELFDIFGRLVVSNLKPVNDISSLGSGIYIMTVQRNDHTSVFKILKR